MAASGILRNEDLVPEDEENFDEAIRNVNSALVPTRVRYLLRSSVLMFVSDVELRKLT